VKLLENGGKLGSGDRWPHTIRNGPAERTSLIPGRGGVLAASCSPHLSLLATRLRSRDSLRESPVRTALFVSEDISPGGVPRVTRSLVSQHEAAPPGPTSARWHRPQDALG